MSSFSKQLIGVPSSFSPAEKPPARLPVSINAIACSKSGTRPKRTLETAPTL